MWWLDEGWYLGRYTDVAAAGVPAADHYLCHGRKENRDPNRFMDAGWYKVTHILPSDSDAGEHYASHWRSGQAEPCPGFNAAFSSAVGRTQAPQSGVRETRQTQVGKGGQAGEPIHRRPRHGSTSPLELVLNDSALASDIASRLTTCRDAQIESREADGAMEHRPAHGGRSRGNGAPRKTLILYSHHENTPLSVRFARFFCEHAVFSDSDRDHLFIVNGPSFSVEEHVPMYSNVRVIRRPNLGFDFGAWAEGLRSVARLDAYSYFVFTNDSVVGPFVPSYLQARDWPGIFTRMLDDRVKLVGTNVGDHPQLPPHVQSMFLATDVTGLRTMTAYGVFDGLTEGGHEARAVALGREIDASRAILEAGYELDCLMPSASGRRWTTAGPTVKARTGDAYNSACYPRALPGRSDPEPLDVVFFKGNRGISGESLRKYMAVSEHELAHTHERVFDGRVRRTLRFIAREMTSGKHGREKCGSGHSAASPAGPGGSIGLWHPFLTWYVARFRPRLTLDLYGETVAGGSASCLAAPQIGEIRGVALSEWSRSTSAVEPGVPDHPWRSVDTEGDSARRAWPEISDGGSSVLPRERLHSEIMARFGQRDNVRFIEFDRAVGEDNASSIRERQRLMARLLSGADLLHVDARLLQDGVARTVKGEDTAECAVTSAENVVSWITEFLQSKPDAAVLLTPSPSHLRVASSLTPVFSVVRYRLESDPKGTMVLTSNVCVKDVVEAEWTRCLEHTELGTSHVPHDVRF